MPYLDSKILKHNEGCTNPVGKRLYIRDYDEEGKQRFVSWGLTCTTCGVVVKEHYEHNLSPKQLEYKERYDKPERKGSKYAKTFQKLTGHPPPTWEQKLEGRQKRAVTRKLARLRRLQSGPISHRENGLRKKVRHLKRFYNSVGDHIIYPSWPDADEKRELIQNI